MKATKRIAALSNAACAWDHADVAAAARRIHNHREGVVAMPQRHTRQASPLPGQKGRKQYGDVRGLILKVGQITVSPVF